MEETEKVVCNMNPRTPSLPTYFLSHGGGPWPYMSGPFRTAMAGLEQSLQDMRRELAEVPKAILMISGHWEERGFAVSSGSRPGMVYDYGGFPDEMYRIEYGAPGSPQLARRVQSLLAANGMDARLDATRGFDHGTFSVMKPLYPEQAMPIVQLSLDTSLDPALHIAAGRALAPLRDEGVLIVGSGMSYHNLRVAHGTAAFRASRRFDDWLQLALVQASSDERARLLVGWEQAPEARAAHPREDHLLPLMVAVGAAWDEPGRTTFHQDDFFGGITVSSFRFGAPPSATHAVTATHAIEPWQ